MNAKHSDNHDRTKELLLNGSPVPVLLRPSSGRLYLHSGMSSFHKGQHAQQKQFKSLSDKLRSSENSYLRVNSADSLKIEPLKDDSVLRRHSLEALTNLNYVDNDEIYKPLTMTENVSSELGNDERNKEISALFESSTRPSIREKVQHSSGKQVIASDNDHLLWKMHTILSLDEHSLPSRKQTTPSFLKKRRASNGTSNRLQNLFNSSCSMPTLNSTGRNISKYKSLKKVEDCDVIDNMKMNVLPNIFNSKSFDTEEKLNNKPFKQSCSSSFEKEHFHPLSSVNVYDGWMMLTVSDAKRTEAACKIQRWYKRHNARGSLSEDCTQISACDIIKQKSSKYFNQSCTSVLQTRLFNTKIDLQSTPAKKFPSSLVEHFREKIPLIYSNPLLPNTETSLIYYPGAFNKDISQLMKAQLLLENSFSDRKKKFDRRKSDTDVCNIQQTMLLDSKLKKSISENVLFSSQQAYILMHSNLYHNNGTSSMSECLQQPSNNNKIHSANFHHQDMNHVGKDLDPLQINANNTLNSFNVSCVEVTDEPDDKADVLKSDRYQDSFVLLTSEDLNCTLKEEKKDSEKLLFPIVTKKPPLPNNFSLKILSKTEPKEIGSLVKDDPSQNDIKLNELFNSSNKPNMVSNLLPKEEEVDQSNCVEYSSVITSVTDLRSDEGDSLSTRNQSDRSNSSSFPAIENKKDCYLTMGKLEELNRNSPHQCRSKYKGLSTDKIQDIMHYLDEVEESEILRQQEPLIYPQEISDNEIIAQEDNLLKVHCLEFEKVMIKHLSSLDKLVEDKTFLTENFENLKKQIVTMENKHEKEFRMSTSSSSEFDKHDSSNFPEMVDGCNLKINVGNHGEKSLRKLIQRHRETIRKLKEVHAKKIMELREENARDLAKEIARLKKENDYEIAKMLRKDEEMEIINNSFETKHMQWKEQVEYLERELIAQKEQYKMEMERLKVYFNEMREKEITALQAEYIRRHEDESLRHKGEMKKMKEKLKAEANQEIENLKKQHEAEIANFEQELREQLKQEHDHQIELALRRVEEEANSAKEECTKINAYKMRCLREQYEAEIRASKDSQQIIQALNNDLKFQLQNCKEENLLIQTSNQQKDKMIDQLNKRNDETILQMKQAFEELGKVNDLKIKEIQAIHAATLIAKEKELEKLQNSVKQTMKKKDELISKLQDEYRTTTKKILHLEETYKHN